MKIAVIGAGVSGLATAHVLARRHDVTLFDAEQRLGGHAHTVRVDTADETLWVDTGFIVFNDRNYPTFERLLADLDVASQPSDMSFSVADEVGDFEYASTSPNGLFAKRSHLVTPAFLRMIAEVRRFQREARGLLAVDGASPSLVDWLEERRYSSHFVDRLIVPQASAVWSADPREMRRFPARFLAQFFHNHGMLGLRDRPKWRTIVGGSARYVEAIARRLGERRLRLGAPVTAVTRHPDRVVVALRGGEQADYDQVVIATHSDQALALLADPSDREHDVLGAIRYLPKDAVLHTDARLLPRRRRAWASWNCHLREDDDGSHAITYHMNRLQRLRTERELCVTLNRTRDIDPDAVLRRMTYAHPVYTREAHAAQTRHGEISGQNRTHYAGAYWGWGFHEDGVVSAMRVTEALGAGTV